MQQPHWKASTPTAQGNPTRAEWHEEITTRALLSAGLFTAQCDVFFFKTGQVSLTRVLLVIQYKHQLFLLLVYRVNAVYRAPIVDQHAFTCIAWHPTFSMTISPFKA